MSNEEIKFFLGLLAGVISFVSYLVYIFSIRIGTTKPNRFTWIVLTINGLLITTTYYLSGATNTIWVALSYTIGPVAIVLFSIKKSENKWGKTETFSTLGIILSLLVWFLTNSPFIALVVNIVVDFFGLLPTVEKAYARPWTEDRFAWILTLIASILNILALESWSIEISLYPIYLLIVDGAIAFLLVIQKNHSTKSSFLTPRRSK